MTSSKPSIVYFRFKDGEVIYDYLDIRGNCTNNQYDNTINVNGKIDYNSFQAELAQQNFAKYWNIKSNDIRKKMFEQNVLTYFPSYRYELPAYLNDSYSNPLKYSINNRFSGYLPNHIEVISDITSFSNWLCMFLFLLLYYNIWLKLRSCLWLWFSYNHTCTREHASK